MSGRIIAESDFFEPMAFSALMTLNLHYRIIDGMMPATGARWRCSSIGLGSAAASASVTAVEVFIIYCYPRYHALRRPPDYERS